MEEFTDEGKRYYKADTGKIFDADIWDRNFKVSRQLVKKLGYKGKTPLHDGAGIKRSNDIKRFGKGR